MDATRAPLLVALGLVLLTSPIMSQAQPETEPRQAKAEAGVERVWEGYLWKDRKGRIRIGWEVIAMGVMAQAAHTVGGELGKQLEPCVSKVKDSWFFWNYEWIGKTKGEGVPDTAVDRVPRVIVRLRGRVVNEGPEPDPDVWTSQGRDRTMVAGRVEAIEFLSEAWLRAWQDLVKLDFNPYWSWKNGKAIEADAARCRALMAKVVPALLKMRALSRVTEEETGRAQAIDPGARAVNHVRRRMETYAHRWLLRMQEAHGVTIPGMEKLGTIPPDGGDLQRWFCAAADKAAFLVKIRERFDGDLAQLKLPYYVSSQPRSVSWTTVRVNLVEKEWTDDDFKRHQALTRKTLEGHR